jgi:outer membrane biosynthesis protein TonB
MQATARLRNDEQLGLLIAFLAHVAVLGALALQAMRAPAVVDMPQRISVSLAEEVSLVSTAPEPATEAQEAPPPPPSVEKPPPPQRQPVKPQVTQRTVQKTPPPPPTRKPPPQRESRLNDRFLDDAGKGEEQVNPPAEKIGPAEQASLQQAIARQLRPYWKPPSGAGAEDLVTILAFDLNPDGTLNGRPRVVRQTGVTETNRPQAGRHEELAVRAVQLAAPFDLPPKYYNAWKRISNWRFDWKSAQ